MVSKEYVHLPNTSVIRLPVMRAHCESISLEFTEPITPDEVRDVLSKAPGVTVRDDRKNNRFPMPIDASGEDEYSLAESARMNQSLIIMVSISGLQVTSCEKVRL